MPIPILLVTHSGLGQSLVKTSEQIVKSLPTEIVVLDVPFECDSEQLFKDATEHCQRLDKGDGVLIFTDLYGSTPSNIASRLCKKNHCYVISGVNIAMMLCALNYCGKDINDLALKVIDGAQRGIQVQCDIDLHQE